MTPRFGYFELILACSVIISAIFISFFLPLPFRKSPIAPINPIPTSWKTYRNETYKYSLQYPPDWELSENQNVVTISELTENPSWGPGRLNISANHSIPMNIEDWAKSLDDPGQSAPGEEPPLDFYTIIGDTTLGGQTAKQLSRFQFDSNEIIILATNQNNSYYLTYNDTEGNDPKIGYHRQIYNRILSTFHFTDPSQTSAKTVLDQIEFFTGDYGWHDIRRTPQYSPCSPYPNDTPGYIISGYTVSSDGWLAPYENQENLKSVGWEGPINTCDISGSSTWTYRKILENKVQLLQFSYKNYSQTESPCPCDIHLEVFLSDEFTPEK